MSCNFERFFFFHWLSHSISLILISHSRRITFPCSFLSHSNSLILIDHNGTLMFPSSGDEKPRFLCQGGGSGFGWGFALFLLFFGEGGERVKGGGKAGGMGR